MTADEGKQATRRYQKREVGEPRSMICTLCDGPRVPVGALVLCPKCDEFEIEQVTS